MTITLNIGLLIFNLSSIYSSGNLLMDWKHTVNDMVLYFAMHTWQWYYKEISLFPIKSNIKRLKATTNNICAHNVIVYLKLRSPSSKKQHKKQHFKIIIEVIN